MRRYAAERIERACQRALECDVVDVTRISRMLERALEEKGEPPLPPRPGHLVPLRFARPDCEFAIPKIEAHRQEEKSDELC